MKINLDKAIQFTGEKAYNKSFEYAKMQLESLNSGKGAGNDFLGWINLPQSLSEEDIEDINLTADSLRKLDAIVIIGIGGSYLGSKAVIESLSPSFDREKPEILFAGHNLNGTYHNELIEYLKDKEFGIIVISKSGTTTEPAIAFRLLYSEMKKRFDKETIRERIVAITDSEKGALRTLADKEGFKDFIIPDNVGGRFSVLTPVGLLPIAVAGFDISSLLRGASIAQGICLEQNEQNPALQYAAIRNILYVAGYKTELMVNYNQRLNFIAEWWKQLYGESEGKEHKGIFPASVSFTTDLHSLGQYIQQGERTLFETVLYVNDNTDAPVIPEDEDNLDKLNYLSGKGMEFVNRKAFEGTLLAHTDGKVPNIVIEIDTIDEYTIGYLLYFFELACGISGYMLGVNPFDQPGVEDYKKNMFRLLGKK